MMLILKSINRPGKPNISFSTFNLKPDHIFRKGHLLCAQYPHVCVFVSFAYVIKYKITSAFFSFVS